MGICNSKEAKNIRDKIKQKIKQNVVDDFKSLFSCDKKNCDGKDCKKLHNFDNDSINKNDIEISLKK